MYVCVCNGVTETQIKETLNAKQGSLENLRKELGVGQECGCCISITLELIKQKRVESSASFG